MPKPPIAPANVVYPFGTSNAGCRSDNPTPQQSCLICNRCKVSAAARDEIARGRLFVIGLYLPDTAHVTQGTETLNAWGFRHGRKVSLAHPQKAVRFPQRNGSGLYS